MSTALLKFEPPAPSAAPSPKKMPLEPGILAAALAASPDPMAVTENGKLIYSNRSFAQLSNQLEPGHVRAGAVATLSASSWQTTTFLIGTRTLWLTTFRREPPSNSFSDANHLQTLGRMVGGVAHDFNNLLTGILLYCDLIKAKLPPANPLSVKVEEISRAAEQGAGLIRQLMTLGREEKDAPRWVSLNHVVEEIVPLLRHLLGEHIAISTTLAKRAPRVGLSLAHAQQLILNLALNARDAMPSGGQIHLETRLREFKGAGQGGHLLEFSVSDTGTGMDSETAAHIFEPFFTTKPLGRAAGTGLATVKRIVEEAGGSVCVDTKLGKGTRMTIRLSQVEMPTVEVDNQLLAKMQPRRRPQQSAIQKRPARQSRNRGVGV